MMAASLVCCGLTVNGAQFNDARLAGARLFAEGFTDTNGVTGTIFYYQEPYPAGYLGSHHVTLTQQTNAVPLIMPCVTNFVLHVYPHPGATWELFHYDGCVPIHPIHTYELVGTCMLSSGTDCTNLTHQGTILRYDLGYASPDNENVCLCTIGCSFPPYSGSATGVLENGNRSADFWFMPVCNFGVCDVTICREYQTPR